MLKVSFAKRLLSGMLGIGVAAALGGCGGSRTAAPPAETAKNEPAPAPAPAPADDGEGLAVDQIKPVVEARTNEVRGCHTIEYSGTDATSGTMTVDIFIKPDGTVGAVTVVDSSFDSEQLQDCVLSVTRSLQFPSAPGSTDLSWKFKFAAPRG